MAKTKRLTLEFKKSQCNHCDRSDKRELRKGRPNFCGYKNDTGMDTDIRNGHCVQLVPTSKKAKKKEEADVLPAR